MAAAIMAIAAISGCNKSSQVGLPPCNGKPGEVVLVISEDLYNGAAGDTLARILADDEPALPQTGMEGAEPLFDLIQIPPSAFNNMIRPARNLIIFEVDPAVEKPEIKVFRDYWAADQLLIRIYAQNRDQLITLLDQSRSSLVATLRDSEIDRQMAYNKKYSNIELASQLLRKHEIVTSFPKGFECQVDTGNFIWIHYDPADMTQGVLIWTYPYTDQKQLDYPELLSFTDKHLKPRVPGPSTGSYMALDLDMPVLTRTFTLNGNFVTEMRGLWETAGDFMGGPFISWTYVDEVRNRLVTAFGFVYAPKINKRNQVRKVESILKTIDFPDQTATSNN